MTTRIKSPRKGDRSEKPKRVKLVQEIHALSCDSRKCIEHETLTAQTQSRNSQDVDQRDEWNLFRCRTVGKLGFLFP